MVKKFLFFLCLFFLFFSSFGAKEKILAEDPGKIIWEKLKEKKIQCKNLSLDDFETLGKYFMKQMTGESSEAIEKMAEQMLGKENEKEMYSVLGKRLSGCEPTAAFPSQALGFISMLPIMARGISSSEISHTIPKLISGLVTPQPEEEFSWGKFLFVSIIIFLWVWIVVGIVAIIFIVKRLKYGISK